MVSDSNSDFFFFASSLVPGLSSHELVQPREGREISLCTFGLDKFCDFGYISVGGDASSYGTMCTFRLFLSLVLFDFSLVYFFFLCVFLSLSLFFSLFQCMGAAGVCMLRLS